MSRTSELTFLTIDECAEILKVHRTTISRYIKSGEIRCLRIGGRKLVRKSDFIEFIDSRIGVESERAMECPETKGGMPWQL